MNYITDSGIQDLGKIPWGTHFCQLYSGKADLVQSLVPYFIAGLKNNEQCIWITSEPYDAAEAAGDFRKLASGFETALTDGRLKILDYNEWYMDSGSVYGKIAQRWLDEERLSLTKGFDGLRISGNTSFVSAPAWDAFMQYEQQIHDALKGRRILALCSYTVEEIDPSNVFEVIRAHQFSIHRCDGFWEVLGQSESLMRASQLYDTKLVGR